MAPSFIADKIITQYHEGVCKLCHKLFYELFMSYFWQLHNFTANSEFQVPTHPASISFRNQYLITRECENTAMYLYFIDQAGFEIQILFSFNISIVIKSKPKADPLCPWHLDKI